MAGTDDYTRCTRCRRVTQKSTATVIGGFPYGPECVKIVARSVLDSADRDPGSSR